MKYLSVCAGIEAASVAWHPLGWHPLAFSEIEPFPRAVLAHHYPDTPLHGDFTVLCDQPWIKDADILVGGTPCQAFSVAGLRRSLDDDRGNLSLEFVRLADAIDDLRLDAGKQPAIVVWENVPGVLSVKDNAFGCFLSALAGEDTAINPPRGKWTDAGVVDGPRRRIAWRILDAQYFGLAQRRRRVFVVASAREGFDPAAVLLEFEGMRRDTPPRREEGQGLAHPTAPCLTSSGRGVERTGDTRGQDPIVAVRLPSTGDISHYLNAGGMGRQDFETETLVTHALRAEGFDASKDGTGRGTPLVPVAYRTTGNDGVYETGDLVHALTTATDPNSHVLTAPTAYAFQTRIARNGRGETGKGDAAPCVAVANTLAAYAGRNQVEQNYLPTTSMAVRRLTPRECEALQGFPADYTLIPWRNKPAAVCPDGPRYKALGNSMAVPCMRWIGNRIALHLQEAQ